jgi:uncharacterized protein YkwD
MSGLACSNPVKAMNTNHVYTAEPSVRTAWGKDFLLAQNNYQSELLDLINNARQEIGLPPLRFSSSLSRAAQAHAEDLVQNNYVLGHVGSGGSSVSDRAQRAGYSSRFVGENAAAGDSTPNKIFDQWMNSRGHRANMLNSDYTEVGIGYVLNASETTYKHYWVLVLGNPDI